MTTSPRPLAVLLALLLAACTSTASPTPTISQAPSSSPTPIPTYLPSVTPTATPIPLPTGTDAPTPTPAPTATVAPTAMPTATPTPVPTGTAGDLATRLAGPLEQLLEQRRAALDVPGMAVGIIFPDGSTWSGVGGHAELSPAQPVSVDTPFVAGSITKTFVAATIMQLADEDKLSIDDPLSNWLPDYPQADQITLRMLLSHTSGVFNLYESPKYSSLVVQHPHRNWTPQEVLDNLVDEPYCDPGACYHYSNTGFILLGMVIETVTGKPLGTVLRNRLIAPLGLNATFFQGDGPPPASSARGYRATKSGNVPIDDGSNYRPTESEGTVIWAAGGIVASASDLARWGHALYSGDVVSADSLAQITDFTFYARPQGGYYGLGTRQRAFQGINMEGHTGTLRAFNAAMWYLPSLDLTITVTTNLTGVDANAIVDAFLAVAVPAVD